jgi:hypothetical protein
MVDTTHLPGRPMNASVRLLKPGYTNDIFDNTALIIE